MFTPEMPPLVDVDPVMPYIPPPPGASYGGGGYDPFPGAAWGGAGGGGETSTSPWAPRPQRLYESPFKPPATGVKQPPNSPWIRTSTPAWGAGAGGGGYGGGERSPWGATASRPLTPVWGTTPEANWGTGGEGWGRANEGWGHKANEEWGKAAGGWGREPEEWGKANAGWGTKWGEGWGEAREPWGDGYRTRRSSMSGPTPHSPWSAPDTGSGQPISGGWFGGGGGAGAWGEGGEWERRQRSKSRSRSRSKHGSKSRERWNPAEYGRDDGLKRSSSWGHVGQWAGKSRWTGSGDWEDVFQRGGAGEDAKAGYGRFGYHPAEYYPQGGGTPLGPETFNERDLARRPRDWRADYSARPGLGGFISRVGRGMTDVKDYTDPVKRQIHPLLHHQSASNPAVYLDLKPPVVGHDAVVFRSMSRQPNAVDFAQLALQPSAPFMRLFHPKLPWYIDIHQVHPNGVTVADVLHQIHIQLQVPIVPRHFYNEDLSDSERAVIAQAFRERCGHDLQNIGRGVVKLDFLGGKTVFEGLVRGPKGLWEMKMSKDRF